MKNLVIRGCFDGIHGYGAHIRSHLRLLDARGIDFKILYVPLDPHILRTDETLRWKRRTIAAPRPGDTVIHFLEACYIEPFKDCKNIGYTMWETDLLPDYSSAINPDLAWVEKLNACDTVWTGSFFSKKVYEKSGITRPIQVVPWALSSAETAPSSLRGVLQGHLIPLWVPQKNLHRKLRPFYELFIRVPAYIRKQIISFGYLGFKILSAFLQIVSGWKLLLRRSTILSHDETFNILVVNTFNERKNYEDLLAAVLFTFRRKDSVRLIIKTYQAVNSAWMNAGILSKINSIVQDLKIQDGPEIFVITEPLTDAEFSQFLKIGTIYLNTSHGEGVGGGLLLSMAHGIPPVTHLFSSPEDFCNEENSFIYKHGLEPVKWYFNFYGLRQRWARLDMEDLSEKLRIAYDLWKTAPSLFQQKGDKAKASALSYGHTQRVLEAYIAIQKTP